MNVERSSAREFADALRLKRHELSLTQEELAETLGTDVRSVQRWERGTTFPRPKQRRKIASAFGIDVTGIATPELCKVEHQPRAGASKSKLEYEAVSLSDVMRRGGDADAVLNTVAGLIAEWPEPPGRNNFMGTEEKWNEIALASPDTHYYLIEDGCGVVGTWGFAPVDSATYRLAIRGENINCLLRAADLSHPLPGDRVSIYFVDLFRARRISPLRFLAHFLSSMQAHLKQWSDFNVRIEQIVANLATPEIVNLAEHKLGFQFKTEHSCHTMYNRDGAIVPTRIYELDISKSISTNRRLRRILGEAGVLEFYECDST